jgi:hypothetical protein
VATGGRVVTENTKKNLNGAVCVINLLVIAGIFLYVAMDAVVSLVLRVVQ